MNEAQKKEYLDNEGETRHCPFCRSSRIGASRDIQETHSLWAEQDVECYSCHREWTDVYQLVDIRV